ncbi:winged helix DNA-binding domain-containing protein [Actinoplanes awajinensis]|uniref:Winged helix DNA-binding domain-containing protein n=1 Tax=Actinoplanes awajinensis subsp. mycoplanecinus TaxID=135947 RepID=A0A101JHS1_9ACTN|nr:winged helix DNA-binding domain-containing protein [Actinoplanes awajinensis]KUL27029.1 hypothetical protein ADL15_36575 [Actinoplanes awajinensis subsp. mycoplanecinus]
MTTAILDRRALNRATLARQLLLHRTGTAVLDTVAHLGGLQAQEPGEPFIGLWSRVGGFAPAELSRLLEDRAVVRMHLMRRTVHLVTADDAVAWRPRHQSLLRQKALGVYRADLAAVDLDELTARAQDLMADGQPRSLGEVGRALAEHWPSTRPRVLGEVAVAALVPSVQLPPRGTWRSSAGARYLPLSTWLNHPAPPPKADQAAAPSTGADQLDAGDVELVRRYLRAFGPAASADLRAWCGLAGLPKAVAALQDELVTFRDDRGRLLLDLPDAPRPDPETPAPVRFLPAFDNAILGYHDRTRIIDDEHRNLSVAGIRVVLIDGRVAATWSTSTGPVVVTPLRPLTRPEQSEVTDEASRLTTFLTTGNDRN